MSTGSALVRLIMIVISLVSSLVFGNRLEKRPPRSLPLGYQLAGLPQVTPVSSTQKLQQESVALEQASAIALNPAPTAIVTLPNITSAPHSGSTDCGPCYLFFQVGQQRTCAQLMTDFETTECQCTLLALKPYNHQLPIGRPNSCISYCRII